MTASLAAATAALAIGLPIFALGERIRSSRERRLGGPHTSTTRKDVS
jgi:hypothetical protein|nr:MAG TPA: hypothetical protein [Caudoviricetes sp.]